MRIGRFGAIWVALLILVTITTAATGGLDSALPQTVISYASILGVASLGQALVIQQRGIDFSVSGVITLSALIVALQSGGDDRRLAGAIAVALIAATIIGIANGVLVTAFKIAPLIATLAVNSLVSGVIVQYSGGSTEPVPRALSSMMRSHWLGLPVLAWACLAAVGFVAYVMSFTVLGRRLRATGSNAAAAVTIGIGVSRYRIVAYGTAGCLYGVTAVLLSGYVGIPDSRVGDSYLLSTIVAVVIGGTLFAGGRASFLSTAAGALFLVEAEHLVRSVGAPSSIQYIVQGGAIAAAMAVYAAASRIRASRMVRKNLRLAELERSSAAEAGGIGA